MSGLSFLFEIEKVTSYWKKEDCEVRKFTNLKFLSNFYLTNEHRF